MGLLPRDTDFVNRVFFRVLFFPLSSYSFSFCGKVSNEALRVYSLRSVCGLVCPFGGELFELKQRQRKMRGEIPLCETCLFLIRSFVLFLWILLCDLILVFISQFLFRTREFFLDVR